MVILEHDYSFGRFSFEYKWILFISFTNEVLDVENVSAYFLLKGRGPNVNISIFVLLLPYLQEQVHSKATIKYAMDKAKEVSSFFNQI